MPKTKPPWWMYVVVCSYGVYLSVAIYTVFWGPEWIGITAIQDGARVLINAVLSDSSASRAGLQTGDQIVAAAEHNIDSVWDWYAVTFHVNALDRVPVRLVRGGKQFERTLAPPRRSWRSPDAVAAYAFLFMQVAYLAIASVIAFARPFNIHARLGALFLAAAVAPIMFAPDGFGLPSAHSHRHCKPCSGSRPCLDGSAWVHFSRSARLSRSGYFGRGGCWLCA